MKISKDTLKKIKDLISPDENLQHNEPGSLIFSERESPGKFLVLCSGSVRCIDDSKSFNSLTLAKFDSPCVFGISSQFGLIFNEIIRASSSCSYYLVDYEKVDLSLQFELRKIRNNVISCFESLYIYNLSLKKDILSDLETNNSNDFYKKLYIYDHRVYSNSSDVFIYADKEKKGFIYGQQITIGTIRKYFNSVDLPRIICIGSKQFNSNDVPLKNIINDYKPQNNIESKNNLKSSVNGSNNKFNSKKNNIPIDKLCGFVPVRGRGREESYFACLSMIVEFYKLPTRKDTIQKAAEFLDKNNNERIRQLLIVLDNIGINARTVRFNKDKPSSIPYPSIWLDEKQTCHLVLSTNSREIVIFSPDTGLSSLKIREASERFKDLNLIISISLGLHAPKKRFNIAWLLPYLGKYKTQLVEVFAASFLNQIFALATPLLFQQIIDRVISKGANEALTPLVVLMSVFVLLEITFSSLRTFQFVEITNRIDINLGSTILSRLLRLNAKFFDTRPVGELSSRLNELENIRKFLTGTALTVLLDSIFSVLYIAVLFFYSPQLTILILISIPLLILVTVGATPITQKLIRQRAEAQAKTNAYLVEILGGIQTVKLQNSELSTRREWENRHLNTINQSFKAILANTASTNASQLVNKISNIGVIGFGTYLVLQNKLTLGELIAFRIISGNITQPLLRLASSWQSFQELSLSLQRVGDIINQPLEINDNEDANIMMPEIKGDISFSEVSYAYSNTAKPVLSSVSISSKAGEFVALLGQSGCGKSTLLKMIPRLYNPSSGRIFIDNLDISKVELYSLRNQIGFVPQDCLLFEGNIFSNIAIGKSKVDSSKVVEAAKLACAHDFIMNLPYGYGTPIGEKGSGLSGGQRQRIALARMLLENPNMVILDEATSALDVDTERQVLANLKVKFAKKTLLVITHRLSTTSDADRIVVMDAGRIDSMGSHSELMNLKGRYYALYKSQFGEDDS